MIKALIAIRSGSKGLKDKNILTLGSIPLYHWVLFSALRYKKIQEVLISSDSNQYLNLTKETDKIRLLLRDKTLANDTTKISEVITNLVNTKYLEDTKALVLLQATQPFVKPNSIKNAVELLLKTNCDTVITAIKHESSHPSWSFELNKSSKVSWLDPKLCDQPRQDLPPFYKRAGSVYVINVEKFKINQSLYGPDVRAIEVDEVEGVSIDSPFGFDFCKSLINLKNIKPYL